MTNGDAHTSLSVDSAAVEIVRTTPSVLRALVSGLPEAVVEAPNPEGWSLKDIVAHMLDAEGIAFIERINRMLHEERPFIRSIDPPVRLIEGGYAARELGEMLDALESERAEHAAWLAALSPGDLARTGEHDTVGDIRVVDIAHQWAAHDMAHLRQMALMLQTYFAPLMGATRDFYDV